jgi:hypothetical protein
MKKADRKTYLLLLILLKKEFLLRDGTNITLDDLLLYLNEFYFLNASITKKKLLNFLEANEKEIIDFL